MIFSKILFKKLAFNEKFFSLKNIKKKFSISNNKFSENFINKKHFKHPEGFLIYECNDKKFIIFLSLISGGLISYQFYDYFFGLKEEKPIIFNLLLTSTLLFFQYKFHKFPKKIFLNSNGNTTLIQFYKYGGFFEENFLIPNSEFIGFSCFFHNKLRMPIVKYYDPFEKKAFFFIKMSCFKDKEIAKSIFSGNEFIIGSEDIKFKYSSKQKKNYQYK